MEFTKQEIELLIEGLQSILSLGKNRATEKAMLVSMMARDEIQANSLLAKLEQQESAQEAEREKKALRIEVLKGKLALHSLDQIQGESFDFRKIV